MNITKQQIFKFTLMPLLYIAMTILPCCRQAVYEIVKLTPGGDPNEPANPVPFDGKVDNTQKPGSAGPTARVEVIWQGQSVTMVRVNAPTVIQPSADTLDLDDIGKSTCPNPGIVKVLYNVGTEASPTVDRGDRCETLGVPYTFKQPGFVVIKMTVTSKEGETAVATMTLKVVDTGQPITKDGGFTIYATPMVAAPDQDIKFTGLCTTARPYAIHWQFADGTEGDGETTTHRYTKVGSYYVQATCRETDANGRTWTASITVVIILSPPPLPPGVIPVLPPNIVTPPVTPPTVIPGGGTGGKITSGGSSGHFGHIFPWHGSTPTNNNSGGGNPSPSCPVFFIFHCSQN